MKLLWRKSDYRSRRAYSPDGRLVGVIEWAFVADDWNAKLAWEAPWRQLGTYDSEARAMEAVQRASEHLEMPEVGRE